jgi:hypothetical protein
MNKKLLMLIIALGCMNVSRAYADMLVWDVPTEIATAETASAATEGAAASTADAGINAEGHALTAATDEAGFIEQAMQYVKEAQQWVEQKVSWVKEQTLLGQGVTEAIAMKDKLQEQVSKLTALRSAGEGAMAKVLNDENVDHLPDDYTAGLQNAADAINDPTKQGALAAVGEGKTATLFETVTGRIGEAFGIGGSDEKLKLDNAAAAYNRTLSELAYLQAGQRRVAIKGYSDVLSSKNPEAANLDIKDITDLQARIQSTQLELVNEQLKLQSLAIMQKAQEQVAQQMAKQQRLAFLGVNTGSDVTGALTSFVSQAATAATVWNVDM